MEIVRPDDYYQYGCDQPDFGGGVIWWNERLLIPTKLTKAFNDLYGRKTVIMDVGNILASG